jgi:hypothetical protein
VFSQAEVVEAEEPEVFLGCKKCNYECKRFRPNGIYPDMCFNKKCKHKPEDHVSNEVYEAYLKRKEERRLRLEAKDKEKKRKEAKKARRSVGATNIHGAVSMQLSSIIFFLESFL